MPKLTEDQLFLRALAQRGASARLDDLRQEMATLEKLIAGGKNGHLSLAKKPSGPAQTAPVNTPRKKPTRKGMSLAARKAHSLRMKKFWAGKRKEAKAESAATK